MPWLSPRTVRRDRFPETHVLSTRVSLRTLENFGRTQSAQAVFDGISSKGSQLARYAADPAPYSRFVNKADSNVSRTREETRFWANP